MAGCRERTAGGWPGPDTLLLLCSLLPHQNSGAAFAVKRRHFLIGASATGAAATRPAVMAGVLGAFAGFSAKEGVAAGPVDRHFATVSDYVALRRMPATAGAEVAVARSSPGAGLFKAMAIDAPDDGGMVIGSATSNLKWVRQGANTPENPIRLGWFQRDFGDGPRFARSGDAMDGVMADLFRLHARVPEALSHRLMPTGQTVGIWHFNGSFDHGTPPVRPGEQASLYVQADFPVTIETLDVPVGFDSVRLAGPVSVAAAGEIAVRQAQAGASGHAIVLEGVFIAPGKAFGVDGDPARVTITIDGHPRALDRFLYVDPVNGHDSHSGERPSAAKRTLAGVMSLAGPGRTVWLSDGIYRDQLEIAVSGTAEAPVTFRALNRHRAWVRSTVAGGSWLRMLRIFGCSHVHVIGIRFGLADIRWRSVPNEQQVWGEVDNSHHLLFEDCLFLHAGSIDRRTTVFRFTETEGLNHDIILRACVFREALSFNAVTWAITRNFLVEGCAFGEALHANLMNLRRADEPPTPGVIVRGNVMLGNRGRTPEVDHTWGALIEDNLWAHGRDAALSHGSAGVILGTSLIVRHNQFVETWGPALNLYPHSDKKHHIDARWYGNVFAFNTGSAVVPSNVWSEHHRPQNAHRNENIRFVNNLFYMNDTEGDGTQIRFTNTVKYRSQTDKYRIERNAVYNGGHPLNLTWGWNPGGAPLPAVGADDIGSAAPTDNIIGDPMLKDADLWDFSAAAGSYLHDNGVPLAYTASAGTGTELPVDDVLPFYAGQTVYDAATPGDLISIGGRAARVIGRDADSGTLTLDRPVEWRQGDPVGFTWAGTAPDLGIIEHGEHVRPHLQVLATGRWITPGTVVTLSLAPRGIVPVFVEWWLGNTVKKIGASVSHAFTEEGDHPIRVRATCADGSQRWATFLITCRTPRPPEAPLMSLKFDSDAEAWFVKIKTYRPGPARLVTELAFDRDLRRDVLEIAAISDNADDDRFPMTCIINPETWDIRRYPRLHVLYKCPAGVPLTFKIAAFRRSAILGSRDLVFAAAPAAGVPHPVVRLIDDGDWNQADIDIGRIVADHWDNPPRLINGVHLGCWGRPAARGMTYRVAGFEIRSAG